jgi:hypothetical protein
MVRAMSRALSVRIAAWLALAALVLHAVWPNAADANAPGIPQDICSVDASKYPDAGHYPAKLPTGEHRLRHCALCLPGMHGALATSPGFPWLARLPQGSASRLESETAAPSRIFSHLRAQPRAPPAYA